MIVTFIGHAIIPSKSKVKEMVKEIMRMYVFGEDPVICYLGGYGDFDEICALACKELKKEFASIELVYVTPYLRSSQQEKIKMMQSYGLCDSSLYPPIENTPPKFAISKRNEWMVSNAEIIISYTNHNYGGAYQSLEIAKRKKKRIINICDFLA